MEIYKKIESEKAKRLQRIKKNPQNQYENKRIKLGIVVQKNK
jgi:hypothetical protein